MTELHTIPPIYDAHSKLLVLGSFPSVKSREAGFFYGHPQNRFWRLMALLLDCPVPDTIEQKKTMLLRHGIALWDVIASCDITGSADSSISNVVPNDIAGLLSGTQIKRVFTNGATAHRLYRRYCMTDTGIADVRLPSTSPANAACSLDDLADSWRVILA